MLLENCTYRVKLFLVGSLEMQPQDMSNLIKLAEIFDCSLDTIVLGIEPKEDKIDKSEFVFDPRKGKYIRRRSEHMNFWEFAAAYWWAAIPILAILGGTIPDIIQALK